ncbi:phosphoglycerate kinase [Roseospira marina]|uniref:Phosphoglycerate kinase n=1 Tax=Roseospira marina TaxID=140057 RepID=A0A5M6IE15_9PROT|nr:phosphoglycerate kinase [Roseospira marina]KAA5606483.1 phosphoglycerate kinase [Roseospira marina]MBB4314096.1 phosphoglycerate kinase [Roseospira marina]MBB5087257.1 phosphoglycerate kinase [Roseospira marina]
MPDFKTIDDLDVNGKRVLVRADLNVPVRNGVVTDTTRIDRSAQTIKDLMEKGACVVIMSHFGRPKGQRVPDMSLQPVLEPLSKALGGVPVAFADDCIGAGAETLVNGLAPGDVALLENVRFHAGEEKNDPDFARKLAELGDVYVNDAFSSAHRAHASTEYLAQVLPSAAGRLMEAELEALGKALESPARPLAAIVGGAKVSSKLDLLGNMVAKVDMLVIGGGMANTFLFAQGVEIGASLCEKDMADTARAILEKAKVENCEIILPVDAVVASEFKDGAANETVDINAVPADKMILDVGSMSAQTVIQKLAGCKTLVWNGPMGAFEIKPFDAATNAVAQAAAKMTNEGTLLTVAGGGDTVSALANAGVVDQFSYVSTAGGAFLEWLEGKVLPGVAALKD